MAAEKQIVKYWLNKQGFYTLDNIKAGNKDIDFIAIKAQQGKISQIDHVEVSCSISSTSVNLSKLKGGINKHIKTKFSNPVVVNKIKKVIKGLEGTEKEYRKISVLSMLPKSNKKEIIEIFKNKGIIIYEFENILSNVMQSIDTHYYKDDTIRTLQIIKYLLLSKPSKLVGLIKENETNILKQAAKENLFRSLLKYGKIEKALEKADGGEIASLIRGSSLKNPKKLAQIIVAEVLGKRSKGKFLRALMEEENMKDFFKIKKEKPKEPKKKETPLGFFFDN